MTDTHGPRYTPLVQSLPATVPFVGPETQERARKRSFAARLGANESVFGPSPKALNAMADAARDAWMYGDPESFDLRRALATRHGISMDNIVVGEGIDGLLGYLVRLMVGPGDAVVTSAGAYPTFNYHVVGFGGALHAVPYRDDHEDPAALIEAARRTGAKLIYLANPDNPMGTWHAAATLEAMVAEMPEGCVLVLDEAYVEFAPEDAVAKIAIDDPRVIRMRTFSKAHGMAGARVGYALGAVELITAFNKVRNHFGMSRIGQAGALAALGDPAHLAHIITATATARTRIAEIGARSGLRALPSATNFVTLDCGGGADRAKSILTGLIARDLFVRMPFVSPQDRCIRISVGTPDLLDLLAEQLPGAVSGASGP